MLLLFDIGNTRLKWAAFDGQVLGVQQAATHVQWSDDAFVRSAIERLPRPDRVLVSNVGGEVIADRLRRLATDAWKVQPEFVVSTATACGVRNAYDVPGNLGVDRWLAVIAAHAREKRLTCIVSFGTAMTIDGVDASGQHLGGVIVPGPDLMVNSLLQNTSEIASRARNGKVEAALFAGNTLGAIRQGAAHALAALVERAVESMRTSARAEPKLLIGGGAAAVVEGLIRVPHEIVHDLVLQGLARVSQER